MWEDYDEHSFKDFSAEAAFRQKDGAGQGGAHCGQRVESGPAGIILKSSYYTAWVILRFQVFALVTLGLGRLGDAGTSLQFGSNLDSHWLGQMTTAGWVKNASNMKSSPKTR